MKPGPFEYKKPDTLDAAIGLLAGDSDAAVLAGGQSLLAIMNMRLARPSLLVDVTGLEALRQVHVENGRLRIGALVRHAELERSPVIREHAPLLAEAALELAHPAIRNRGTIGGSIALADPAAELPACVLALDAAIEVTGPDGVREIPSTEFFLGPYESALAPAEVLTAILVPLPAPAHAYVKLARRHGDYALAGVALVGTRPVAFAVGDRPTIANAASAALAKGDVEAAVASLAQDLAPLGQPECSAATKLHLAGTALRRAVARLDG